MRPVLFVLSWLLFVSRPALAFERTPIPATERPNGEWHPSADLEILAYYNVCTGWSWNWELSDEPQHYGVVYERSADGSATDAPTLVLSWHFHPFFAPAGYGLTGVMSVHEVDANNCPTGPALASQPHLPEQGWQDLYWNVPMPSQRFALVHYTTGQYNATRHESISTDHPAPGPTGPAACGNCYPTTRQAHSFHWGLTSAPICPGDVFTDNSVCTAELMWEVVLRRNPPTSSEQRVGTTSWARIKGLFR